MNDDLSDTRRCVKCGLCLPHCPTFALSGNEADSPRGRLSLMEMLEYPDSDWSPGLFRHLDRCLMCHACEAMCPSQVPYTRLMDRARARLQTRRPWRQRLVTTLGLSLLTRGGGRRLTALAIAAARRSGVRRLPSLPAPLRRLLQLLPPEGDPPPRVRDRRGTDGGRGTINLFSGCTGELFDSATRAALGTLLERLGYKVNLVARAHCCGALHQHAGRPRQARELALASGRAFAGNNAPIVSFASGCSAHLRSQAQSDPALQPFARRVIDAVDFLVDQDADALPLTPLPEPVAIHLPCTQRHCLNVTGIQTLLSRIPQLRPVVINPEGGCCGAAGAYMLTQPELSDRLRDAQVERIAASGARLLVTSNIGCALQLAAGLRQRGVTLTPMHPATLLALQLAQT